MNIVVGENNITGTAQEEFTQQIMMKINYIIILIGEIKETLGTCYANYIIYRYDIKVNADLKEIIKRITTGYSPHTTTHITTQPTTSTTPGATTTTPGQTGTPVQETTTTTNQTGTGGGAITSTTILGLVIVALLVALVYLIMRHR